MKRFMLGVCIAVLTSAVQGTEIPTISDWVNDHAQVLSHEEKNALRDKLLQFSKETLHQMVILTTPDLGGQPIEEYSLAAFNQNGLGYKMMDNGILIVIAPNERQLRIELGKGMEKYISDRKTSSIINKQMVPRIKEDDYASALEAATDELMEKSRKFDVRDAKNYRRLKPEQQFEYLINLGKAEYHIAGWVRETDVFMKAAYWFEKATKAQPRNPEGYYRQAYALDRAASVDGATMLEIDLERVQAASDQFKQAHELDPSYQGPLTLDPLSKITSLWGSVAVKYIHSGNLDSVKWAFNKGLEAGGFYPAIREYAYNLLITCEPDAILFTNGDMDTFPLLYMQYMEGVRPHVRVINLSLLNTPWYAKFQKRASPPVPISLSDQEIDSLGLVRWESREMSLEGPDDSDMESLSEIRWIMEPTIARQTDPNTGKLIGGLRIQDALVFEIMKKNKWQYPIYFASTVASLNLLGLQDHLRLDGQAYQLVPMKVGNTSDIGVLKNYLSNKLKLETIKASELCYIPSLQRLWGNYRKLYLQLVFEYLESGEDGHEEALDVLYEMDRRLPDAVVPMRYMDLYLQIAQLYKYFGDAESAVDYMNGAFLNGRQDGGLEDKLKVAVAWNDHFDETSRAISVLVPLNLEAPENAQVVYELARAYVKSGDPENSEKWVARLRELVPDATEIATLEEAIKRLRSNAQDGEGQLIAYDSAPEPEGGFEAIMRAVVYPEIAREAGIEGTVTLQVHIDKTGRVVDVHVLEGLPGTGLDESAEAAIRSVKWTPAMKDGGPVAVYISVPVVFKLKSK